MILDATVADESPVTVESVVGPGLERGLVGEALSFRVRATRLALRRDLDRRMARFRLTPIQFAVLELVHANPDATPAAISECLYLDRSSVAATLRELSRRGIVVLRRSAPRRQGARLTPRGRVLHDRAAEALREQDRLLTAALGADGRAALERLMERVSLAVGPPRRPAPRRASRPIDLSV